MNLSLLAADDAVTCAFYAKGKAFHILMVGKGSRTLQRGTNMIIPV